VSYARRLGLAAVSVPDPVYATATVSAWQVSRPPLRPQLPCGRLGLQMTHLRFRPGLDPCRRFCHQMQAQTSTPPPRQVEHGGLCRRDAATERI